MCWALGRSLLNIAVIVMISHHNNNVTVRALGLVASNPRRYNVIKALSGFLGKGVDILKFRAFPCIHLVEEP
jgi:hypothetical protein